ALQATINQMSIDGTRISHLPSKGRELSQFMAQTLDDSWKEIRGMEVLSVGIASISYDDESKEIFNMRNKGAMLTDPNIREGFVQGSIARGMEAAGSNEAGAGTSFMGMGIGMAAGGGFMGQSSQTNLQQMQMQQQQAQARQQPSANEWQCDCGAKNNGKFCGSCGSPKPEANKCTQCGTALPANAKFCTECGTKVATATQCGKCGANVAAGAKFCNECGEKLG
ncbi:MAG: zinc ribbon domain-containing protein, partial [Neisseriaceae bacterium]|nr:zinc ribbon domain-containing protein [Neisseriaceae bacterium]